jgi:hypothetical protein
MVSYSVILPTSSVSITYLHKLEGIISKHAGNVDGYSVQRLVGKASDGYPSS